MGSVAASGVLHRRPGPPDSSPTRNITGSIGVIMEFTNSRNSSRRSACTTRRSKAANIRISVHPVRPMTDEDRAILQALIDDVHSQFIDAIAAGAASVWTIRRCGRWPTAGSSPAGKPWNLAWIDELGSLEAAIGRAGELAGIEGQRRSFTLLGQTKTNRFSDAGSVQPDSPGPAWATGRGLQYVWSGFN